MMFTIGGRCPYLNDKFIRSELALRQLLRLMFHVASRIGSIKHSSENDESDAELCHPVDFYLHECASYCPAGVELSQPIRLWWNEGRS